MKTLTKIICCAILTMIIITSHALSCDRAECQAKWNSNGGFNLGYVLGTLTTNPIADGKTAKEVEQYLSGMQIFLNECPCFDAYEKEKIKTAVSRLKPLLKEYYKTDPSSWEATQQQNTIQAYTDYLNNYPSGKYRTEAQQLLTTLIAERDRIAAEKEKSEFSRALSFHVTDSLVSFKSRYPNSRYTSSADSALRVLQEEAEYVSTKQANVLTAYANFQSKYPESKYSAEIKDSIVLFQSRYQKADSEEYRKLKASRAIEDYNTYAKDFPEGKYIEEVRSHITDVEQAQKAREHQEAARADSLSAITNDICRCYNIIDHDNGVIAQEKEIGLRSGYENKAVIYEATKSIIYAEERIKANKTIYQHMTKKQFSKDLCKDYDNER